MFCSLCGKGRMDSIHSPNHPVNFKRKDVHPFISRAEQLPEGGLVVVKAGDYIGGDGEDPQFADHDYLARPGDPEIPVSPYPTLEVPC